MESGERDVRFVEMGVRKEQGEDIEREGAKSMDIVLIVCLIVEKGQSIDHLSSSSLNNESAKSRASHEIDPSCDVSVMRLFLYC